MEPVMKIKLVLSVCALVLAVGTIAVRISLDTPQAFAQIKKTDMKDPMADHDMLHDAEKMDLATRYIHGDLTISKLLARATVPGASVGGGYMTITNNGTVADRLLGGSTGVSKMLEVHSMKMVGDVMQMRPLPDGIIIEPGATVTLQPGGLHIMFMGLDAPLAKDTSFKAELNFENAGPIDVEFMIKDRAAFSHNH
jgi:copper(I)-binding protein